jgi:hypothetical protein
MYRNKGDIMKYAVTTKNWDKIKNEVKKMLNGKFRSNAYVSSDGFISEVSFTYGTIGSYEGMYEVVYDGMYVRI